MCSLYICRTPSRTEVYHSPVERPASETQLLGGLKLLSRAAFQKTITSEPKQPNKYSFHA